MKVKMKFDMDKVKAFGIEHGEKFFLALAVLILGWFIVKAVSREHLPEQLAANKIDERSNQADTVIKATHLPPPAQEVGQYDFVSMVNKEATVPKINFDNELVRPPFDDLVKRVDPTLFPVEELQAVRFRGGIAVNALAGNARPVAGAAVPAPAAGAPPAKAVPPVRPGVRGGPGGLVRPPIVGGLLGNPAAGAAPAEKPFPADFNPPGPAGSGAAEGVHGIVITGLIPELAQREEYARRFKNARRGVAAEGAGAAGLGHEHGNAGIDLPQYVWCKLERTDKTDGTVTLLDFGDTEQIIRDIHEEPDAKAQVKELRISPTERNKLEAEMRKWSGMVPEVADPNYVSSPWFTWALPPVLLRNWGAEAAHPPKVPLAVAAVPVGPGNVVAPGQNAAQPDAGFDNPNAVGPGVGPGRGPSRGPGGMRRHPPAMPQGVNPNAQAVAEEIPYKLFRFIDLNVEPGHVYQYRVQMLLRNPNFGLEAQVLLKPDTASVAYRETPWSEKSPVIAIPPDTRLLGGAIERPKRQEPKAKVGIFTFDKDQAIELLKEFDTELGVLVGTEIEDKDGHLVQADPIAKDVADPVERMIHDITGDFRSKAVLLDMRGNDEKLPGANGMTDPGEMLLIDNIDDPEHAKLIVVNQAKDLPTIDDWNKTHVAPAAPAANAIGPEPAKGGAKAGGLIPGGGLLPPVTPKPGPTRKSPGAR